MLVDMTHTSAARTLPEFILYSIGCPSSHFCLELLACTLDTLHPGPAPCFNLDRHVDGPVLQKAVQPAFCKKAGCLTEGSAATALTDNLTFWTLMHVLAWEHIDLASSNVQEPCISLVRILDTTTEKGQSVLLQTINTLWPLDLRLQVTTCST